MGERELREKYGGKLAKAINRAIRAECPGGNEALDKLTHLSALILQAGWTDRHGNPTPEAADYAKHKRNVVDKLEALIREKWGIPAEKQRAAKPRGAAKHGAAKRAAGRPVARKRRPQDQADRTPDRYYRGGKRKSV